MFTMHDAGSEPSPDSAQSFPVEPIIPPNKPLLPLKKLRRKPVIILIVVFVVGCAAAAIAHNHFKKPTQQSHANTTTSTEQAYNAALTSKIKSLEAEYIRKDKSGENDRYYRRIAANDLATARTFTFDTYDISQKFGDLGLSERATDAVDGEAKNLLIAYSTQVNGGFSPYSSSEVIRIQEFDIRDFSGYTNQCGPTLMTIAYASQDNNIACQATSSTFSGSTIYKDMRATYPYTYDVTVNNTRIIVKTRSQQEAFNVIQSMKKTPVDQLDFFIKN
jgi:hypothetical protein